MNSDVYMNSDRRTFLLMAGAAVLTGPAAHMAKGQGTPKAVVPHVSWDCGMKDGIPNPESGSLIFETELKLDRLAKIGKTPSPWRAQLSGRNSRAR